MISRHSMFRTLGYRDMYEKGLARSPNIERLTAPTSDFYETPASRPAFCCSCFTGTEFDNSFTTVSASISVATNIGCFSRLLSRQTGRSRLSCAILAMPWMRFGRFWGYGDPAPHLLVFTDSILNVRGVRGRADATPMIHWMLSMCICPTVIVPHPGARVLRGDYLDMAHATMSLQATTTLIISMGNDLYGRACDGGEPSDIADGLRRVLSCVSNGYVIYGGSAAVWGYADTSYDTSVAEVCALLNCDSGANELLGVRTADAIGHLRVESVPQLCTAILHWCRPICYVGAPKARL